VGSAPDLWKAAIMHTYGSVVKTDLEMLASFLDLRRFWLGS